jgi:cysteinyl-tRNA synthetase
MIASEFRSQMESYRRAVNEEAMALKDSYLALERLHTMYRKFDDEERKIANQVLAEWALSEDENMRFDALALIDDFKIEDAMSALRELAYRLTSSSARGAEYELRKVNRIQEGIALKKSGGK